MKRMNFKRTILAGFAATVAMSMLMMLVPLMGVPKIDIPGMLGGMLAGGHAAPGSAGWIVGLLMHLMIGSIVLPAGYALIHRYLPSSNSVTNGAFFGFVVWMVMQLMVMPMLGAGLFSSHMPSGGLILAATLIAHLVYGSVLGLLYGGQAAVETWNRDGSISIFES